MVFFVVLCSLCNVRLLIFAVHEVFRISVGFSVRVTGPSVQHNKTHFANARHLLNSGCRFLCLCDRNNKTHIPNVLRRSRCFAFLVSIRERCQTLLRHCPSFVALSRALPAGPEHRAKFPCALRENLGPSSSQSQRSLYR